MQLASNTPNDKIRRFDFGIVDPFLDYELIGLANIGSSANGVKETILDGVALI
jgi:hypothetical protein